MGLPRNEGRSSRLESGQASAHTRRMAIFTPNSSHPSAKQELLSYIIGAVMLAALIYGSVRFYDPAFRECASGYFCKGEQLHTAVEYRAFRVWQAAVLIGWPIGVGVLIFLQRNRLRA